MIALTRDDDCLVHVERYVTRTRLQVGLLVEREVHVIALELSGELSSQHVVYYYYLQVASLIS